MSAVIRTFTGRRLDLSRPSVAAIAIEDIAHGLAQTCRFSGQCARFYSVAEHAIRVSAMVPPADGLAALLHDASEAYLSDLVSPLKRSPQLWGYRAVEAELMGAIGFRFGLAPGAWRAPVIVQADQVAVDLELAVLFEGHRLGATLSLACWSPPEAEARFLERFETLSRARDDCRAAQTCPAANGPAAGPG